MNKCNICGKFRKWQELEEFTQGFWNADYDEADQKEWYECIYCEKQENNQENNYGR